MQTQDEILVTLTDIINNRQRVIVLLRHTGKSAAAAELFRAHLIVEEREKLLKPPGSNPDFVKLTSGAWVFFIACEELTVDEEVGQPDYVLWPSEGGDYAVVKHRDWKLIRAKEESPWRPVEQFEDPVQFQEGSVWDRLTGEDEIG